LPHSLTDNQQSPVTLSQLGRAGHPTPSYFPAGGHLTQLNALRRGPTTFSAKQKFFDPQLKKEFAGPLLFKDPARTHAIYI